MSDQSDGPFPWMEAVVHPLEVAGGLVLPMPLDVTAALVGGYRWIEHGLYELLGSWVIDTPMAGVQVHLDAQSTRHAWHAELWADRLPVLHGVDPDSLTTPPDPAGTLLTILAGSRPPGPSGQDGSGPSGSGPSDSGPSGSTRTAGWVLDTPDADADADADVDAEWDLPGADVDAKWDPPGVLPRLAGLYRVVLPRLIVSYRHHLEVASAVTDAPLMRALRLVLADELEDWHAGERMLQHLVTRPHDVEAVCEFQRHLELEIAGSSLVDGLVTFPPSRNRT